MTKWYALTLGQKRIVDSKKLLPLPLLDRSRFRNCGNQFKRCPRGCCCTWPDRLVLRDRISREAWA